MCRAQRGHIGIEAFVGLLSPRANRIRLWLVDVASLLFCAFFAWKSWTLAHEAWVDGQVSNSMWSPPLAIPYVLMATGMTLLCVQILLQIIIPLSGDGAPMTVLGIGISYGVATLLAMFSGMPIAFALGAVAVVFMAIYMPHGLARYGDAERLRGNGLDHAAVDPAVHPQGRGDRQIPRRPGSLFGAACLAASRARRARRRQRVRLRAVRGDGGLLARDLFGDRLGRHSRRCASAAIPAVLPPASSPPAARSASCCRPRSP